jgi:cation transport ATPase
MQNLAIAMSVIVFASIPALAGMLPLWLAVILHEGGTVLVALNAIRLLKD